MKDIEKTTALARKAQTADYVSGWFEWKTDGRLEHDAVDVAAFIAALEAVGYRIESEEK
jgi:hypothetical protein